MTVSDISVVLDHFDQRVIQSSYEPYNGFNFYYLFVTSVCLICVSHILNLIYWAVRRHINPMVKINPTKRINSNFYFSDLTSKGGGFKYKEGTFPDPSIPTHLLAHPPLLPHHRAHHPPGGEQSGDLHTLGGDGPGEDSAHGCIQRYQDDR